MKKGKRACNFYRTCSLDFLEGLDDTGKQLIAEGDINMFAMTQPQDKCDQLRREMDAARTTLRIIDKCIRQTKD